MPATREEHPAGRASIACFGCRRQKIRCYGGPPCERCSRLSLDCNFGEVERSSSSPASSRTKARRSRGARNRSTRLSTSPGFHTAVGGSAPTSRPMGLRPVSAQPSHGSPDASSTAPFSAFSFPPETDSPGALDLLVPRCAQPFPEMQDPIECGLVTSEFARWLFDFYNAFCAPYLPFEDLSFEETRRRSPFLLSAMLSAAFVNTPNDHRLLQVLPSQIDLLGDRHTGDLLANLALNHLAKSLLGRIYGAEDAMAVMIMGSLWSHKRVHGAGPAPWPLVGHAQRIARRGRVHHAAWAAPLSSDGLLVASLDIHDHVLTLGYGRPLTSDRPPPLTDDMISHFAPRNPWQWAIIAQSELVPHIRHLIHWGSRSRHEGDAAFNELIAGINDSLDAWFFKWTSPASEHSEEFRACGPYTLILAHNVRLCLNLLPLWKVGDGQEQTAQQSRSYRLALAAAVEIVDLHVRELRSPPIPGVANLRFAPNVVGTILAHAVLCLQPQTGARTSSFTPLASFTPVPSPTIEKYFNLGMEVLKSDQWNQGRFTPALARRLTNVLGSSVQIRTDAVANNQYSLSAEQDWMTTGLESDFSTGIMGWLEDDGLANPLMDGFDATAG